MIDIKGPEKDGGDIYAGAEEHFNKLVADQFARIMRMGAETDFIDYARLDTIVIGVAYGDGIGPSITSAAERVLKKLLGAPLASGRVRFVNIDGLTIENRAAANKAIPEEVLAELKKCHVILKGPTTTPKKGDPYPNVESANVAMRKELDLFANVRPVRVPELGIDWRFFRENTEGAYAVGNRGIMFGDELAIDFTVTTREGTERIARAAFAYARRAGKRRVTAVTKANVVKATDGMFLEICGRIAEEYPEIAFDDWLVDIMTAKLLDVKRRSDFQVFVLPNLYGDILTDEAAELQGGVGTAGSANIGKRWAMFEAIHGSAPRMVEEGRDIYADPGSVLRAGAILLEHIGYAAEAEKLEMALDKCAAEKKIILTGRANGATTAEYADYIAGSI